MGVVRDDFAAMEETDARGDAFHAYRGSCELKRITLAASRRVPWMRLRSLRPWRRRGRERLVEQDQRGVVEEGRGEESTWF